MFFDVTEAQYIDNYRIRLSFEDGSTGIADLSDYPNENNVFRSFLGMNYFRDFRIEYGTIPRRFTICQQQMKTIGS